MTLLNKCQLAALEIMEEPDTNVYLTGAAGTGKSFLTRHFLSDKNLAKFPIVASTGVSALLVGGVTLHRFFGFGISKNKEEAIASALSKSYVHKRLSTIHGILIDEISMVHDYILDAAEKVCRLIRCSDDPWGGLKVITVGDFRQLPPIDKLEAHDSLFKEKPYCFNSYAWSQSDFECVKLDTYVRQDDEEFLSVLRRVRAGVVTNEVASFLDSKITTDIDNFEGTMLFGYRNDVDRQNSIRLGKIKGKLWTFDTEYLGEDEYAINTLKKEGQIPQVLRLKIGALVMIRKNDPDNMYANGSLATVESISNDSVGVRVHSNGTSHKFSFYSDDPFTANDSYGNPVAYAHNFPLTLAYATTIHKSQGMTLEKVLIDLRKLWEYGQAYVALSRVKSPSGLYLSGWDQDAIRADPTVTKFYKEIF